MLAQTSPVLYLSFFVVAFQLAACEADPTDSASAGGVDAASADTSGDISVTTVDAATEPDSGPPADASSVDANISCPELLPYASELVMFEPGPNAGFGAADPDGAVLGPPPTSPPTVGSLEVLSLGVGGEVVVGFGDRDLTDGPGPDFIVFENAFWYGGGETPFAELGEIAVSQDGETWHTFPCDPEADGFDPGCAGWRPTLEYAACKLVPLSAELAGGDAFDLADLGLSSARYVRIRDLATEGAAPTAGFDLDAVGGIHLSD
ncbi:MAG: hypothetical protein ACI9WU_003101 [Myxococcota bacterium]|jgi:hypothetical protein